MYSRMAWFSKVRSSFKITSVILFIGLGAETHNCLEIMLQCSNCLSYQANLESQIKVIYLVYLFRECCLLIALNAQQLTIILGRLSTGLSIIYTGYKI